VNLARIISIVLFSASEFGFGKEPKATLPEDTTPKGGTHLEETPNISAFFKAHCTKCHNAEKKKGGINFLKLTDFRLENAKHWQEALDNLQRGDMPPEESIQPSTANRKVFVDQVLKELDIVYAGSNKRDFRFSRLTNSQIAWTLRDLLQIDRDFSGDLIEDPVGKHGESLQSELELTAGHMEVYLNALQNAVELAVPDLNNPPKPYVLHGNDWEKQHYLNRNDLAHGNRRKHRRYRGPKWLGDDFEVPVPPNHFFRIYVDDNRPEGRFRIRIRMRNESPQNGGDLAKHEFSVFFDRGFKSPQHTIDNFTVEAKPGSQEFEVFGNVFDFPGVDPAPVSKEDPYGITAHFHYRFLTVQNTSPLTSPSDKPVTNKNWVIFGDAHFIRADDRWTDAWGQDFAKTNWLKTSHGGSDHPTRGKPAVYKEVMKDTSYAVIERIEFDLPWQWPPASVQPFLKDGKLDDDAITAGVKGLAKRAWRRPLTESEDEELNALIEKTLKTAESKSDALRDLLMAVLADTRYLFYSDVEKKQTMQNHELVGRLAAFLWRSVPDQQLFGLASRDRPITDTELSAEVKRMLADSRSDRFISDFTSGWAGFPKLEQIAINPNYYRWWNPKYKDYMKLEPAAFLKTLLQEDLSCLNCLSSDFMVINDVMAKYYGAPLPESGHRFSRAPAIKGRGGILTQAAFLLAHSDGEDANAVNRGVWIRGRLLGDPPRDPPPEVPALSDLDEADPNAAGLSTKERLSVHRKGICLDCHADIDSWGIPMESYDATGKLRDKVLRLTPDQKVKRRILRVFDESEPRGAQVKGMKELQKLLREKHAKNFARGFSSSMLSFALGRTLSYQEEKALAHLTSEFEKSDYRMARLIDEIVRLPAFRHPNKKLP
tara:strand:- start:1098 stop:3743 length:2646 start_codon:yes stop_codon:yes gene_type:complete